MSITIEEPVVASRRRKLVGGFAALTAAATVVFAGGVAQAAVPKIDSIVVSGDLTPSLDIWDNNANGGLGDYAPVSVVGSEYTYTIEADVNGVVDFTVEGAGYFPTNTSPSFPGFTLPTYAGFYATVGNVTLDGFGQWRPSVVGSAAQIESGPTWWVNDANPTPGLIGGSPVAGQEVVSGSGDWSADYSFTITEPTLGNYEFSGSRPGTGGAPIPYTINFQGPTLQFATFGALGTYGAAANLEQVINIDISGL